MKLLQIDGWGFFFRRVAENPSRPAQQLVFPLLDRVSMNIELLRKLGEGLLAANGSKGHLRFESRTVIPPESSGHSRSPVLGKIADLQAEISLMNPVQFSRATSFLMF